MTLVYRDLKKYFVESLETNGHPIVVRQIKYFLLIRTLEAWLKRMDDNKATVMPIVKATYGKSNYIEYFL